RRPPSVSRRPVAMEISRDPSQHPGARLARRRSGARARPVGHQEHLAATTTGTGFRRGADRDLSGNLLLALHTSPRQRADELRAAALGNRLARVPSLAPRRSGGRLREEFRRPALHPRQAVRDIVYAQRANAGELWFG